MKLQVPFISGGEASLSGTASAEMILSYYKIPYDHDAIVHDLTENHGGTDMVQIARLFLHKGFHTDIITLHPGLFKEQDITASQKEVRARIKERIEFALGRTHDLIIYQRLLKYLDEGGCLHPYVPDLRIVQHELDHKRPVLALFATQYDAGGRSNLDCHPIVITGYTHTHLFVHDPLHYKKKILQEWFFSSIYASAHEKIDYGSLLFISLPNDKNDLRENACIPA